MSTRAIPPVPIRPKPPSATPSRNLGPIYEAVTHYIDLGLYPIPVPFKQKAPTIKDWQDLRIDRANASVFFNGKPQNIGVLLGPSDLSDVDVDCPQAVALAPCFLPPTGMIFGRASKPQSHWVYRCPSVKTERYKDVDGATLVEVRGDGAQTIFPGSVHASGETIEFDSDGEPSHIEASALVRSVRKLAAAALLARHWPKGSRHDAALALGGALLRAGYPEDDAADFVGHVSSTAGDDDVEDRRRAVVDTAAKITAGERATGWPALAAIVGEDVISRAREWLGADADDEPPIPEPEPWPQPAAPQAYHGLAGEIVRMIEPHTEADPVALLIQFLVAFGNVVGRAAWFVADGATHHLNLFAVLVGETAKGRKGTSWQQIHRLYVDVAAQWAAERILSGLSSGEGLIWAVRDAIWKREPIKTKGRVEDYQDVQVDPGVDDKRLLALEGEFATPLKSVERDGCTLSPVIRNAWDTGNLRTLTKNSPAVATGAHVSIIGHITRDELRKLLTGTEAANGFANRFLWLGVRRSKVLPEGGAIESVDFSGPRQRLSAAIQFGQSAGELKRDERARALWHQVYPNLSEGKPGMFGAVTSRAEAQVMRLACVYALLDLSATIRVEHLKAALALWTYCESSARYVFGTSLGDRLADEILSALRAAPAGLTRTGIRDLFARNKSAEQIARALGLLLHAGLVRREQVPTGGRPSERWVYAGAATADRTH